MKKALILSGGGARGAYQAGVYKYLEENDFIPDIICGTSVGAINATAIGCGMDYKKLIELWKSIEVGKVLQYSIWHNILDIFFHRFSPLADTTPLKHLMYQELDFRKLRKNKQEIIITAVNILTSELVFFGNKDIDIEHVMASSAIPLFFPWQYVDGMPHWDGGLMANTPLLPAIEREAKDIIVVLLSPVGGVHMNLPKSRVESLERIFELSLIGSYQTIRSDLSYDKSSLKKNGALGSMLDFFKSRPDVRIRSVGPKNSLGMKSILNFSLVQADYLIQRGYEDAKEQLGKL